MTNKKILAAGVLSLLGALFFGLFYASAYGHGNGFYAADNQAIEERIAERELIHEQMKGIIENGTYSDLVAFKEENNLRMGMGMQSGMGMGMQHSGMGKGMNSEMGPKMGQGMKVGKGYGTGPHDGTGTNGPHDGTGTGPGSADCPLNA